MSCDKDGTARLKMGVYGCFKSYLATPVQTSMWFVKQPDAGGWCQQKARKGQPAALAA